ncbi:hypothetical protein [Caulobacter sp. BK020]|uniref:hypothetical protein n=1 Tax=Caulobacter sp. BK020 TaxID=2512117 RepID=UPI00104392EC|nr:hypothetical protein [Caulobacter sp. BK020]TCS02879.1 hypothetical protein EV278_13717 [Caulobacter sp. BK020]
MTSILLVLVLAATTIASPAQDLAGNRLEAFAATPPQGPEGAPPLHCTADRDWCAEISRDVDQNTSMLHVFTGTPTGQPPAATLDLGSDDNDDLTLWPSIVRIAGPGSEVIIGVQRHASASYSGGGGGATQLQLIRVVGDEAKSMLAVPISGSLMIRACFDERDMKARRGACHDEYSFSGDLTLDPTTAQGPPRLLFETLATAFPAGASRNGDSTARGRLRESDLKPTRDPACSYRRVFTLDPVSDVYTPDSPLPDCSDYTAP